MSITQHRQERPDEPYLSVSQIKLYLDCPRKYAFRYIEGIRNPFGIAAFLSVVWHAIVEANYAQKIVTGTDLSLEEMLDRYTHEFNSRAEREEVKLHPGETMEKGRAMGLKVTEVHHLTIAPKVRPRFVEHRFLVDLGPEFPYKLLGFYDLVEDDGTLVDNKAYSKAPSQVDLDKDLQFSIYSLARRIETGEVEPGMRMDAVIKPRNQSLMPKAQRLHTKRDNVDARWTLGLIEDVANGIQKHVFPPNPTGYLCSPKWCDFWSRCKGKGKPVAVSTGEDDDGAN